MKIEIVSILGCGWFGLPFAKALVAEGFMVNGSTTSSDKTTILANAGITPYQIDLNENSDLPSDFFNADVLFICIPPRAKTDSSANYLAKMKRISAAAENRVNRIVFISSTGIFEDGNFVVNELTMPNPDTDAGKVLLAVEQHFQKYTSFTTTIIRFAGLIGPGRNLAKFFAGKESIPNGNAPINLISLEDCIGMCLALLKSQQFGGLYHGVTPHHPTRAKFYTSLCETSGMQKPVFNDEQLAWKQINTINVSQNLGYHFIVKNWFEWLKDKPNL